MTEKSKVYAYIVQDGDLVVFEQPAAPEAGIQVPGGTVHPGETSDAAVLREAFEETGLDGLARAGYLGQQVFDMRPYGKDEQHRRHFYHLSCAAPVPQRWECLEHDPSDGTPAPIVFTLYRVSLNAVPPLVAAMDAFIAKLRHATG